MSADELAAASSIVQTVVVIVALVYGAFQLREASTARRSEVALYIFDRINSTAASARRQALYETAAAGKSLTRADLSNMADVINDFHLLGYLTRRDMIDERLVLEMYYGTITRVWLISEAWVAEERTRRGSVYAEHLEWLWMRAKRYIDWEKPGLSILVSGTDLSYTSKQDD